MFRLMTSVSGFPWSPATFSHEFVIKFYIYIVKPMCISWNIGFFAIVMPRMQLMTKASAARVFVDQVRIHSVCLKGTPYKGSIKVLRKIKGQGIWKLTKLGDKWTYANWEIIMSWTGARKNVNTNLNLSQFHIIFGKNYGTNKGQMYETL